MTGSNLPTAADPISRWYRERPQSVAAIENNVSFTYAALARNIVLAAKALSAEGVCPGVIVGVESASRYLHLIMILACEVLGAAHVTMVPSDLTAGSDLVPRCDVLCVQAEFVAVSRHPKVVRLSPQAVQDMFRQPFDEADLELLGRVYPEDDLVRIGRTSETTGRYKFVMYSRVSLKNNVDAIRYLLKFDDTRQNFISLYNFIQIGSYTDTMSALRHGATVFFGQARELAIDIPKLPACHTFLVVRDAVTLIGRNLFQNGRMDTCSLCVTSGFVPPALRSALRQTVTDHVRSIYSMVETRFITTHDDDGPGQLLPDISVRIVDDAGRDVNPGEPGRILARTPRMASGYLGDDAQTAAYFVDGWFHTSDVGVMPEPGTLTVLGRIDEMVNLGGIKLAPSPLEDRIRAMDGVADGVLVGVENAFGTGDLHVFIERADPAVDQAVDAMLRSLLDGIAASFMVHYVRELPRTKTGKVQRNVLRDSLTGAARI